MTTYCCVVSLLPLLVIHNLCHMVGMPGIQPQLTSSLQSCAPPCFDYIHNDDLPTFFNVKKLKGFIVSLKLPKLWYSYKHYIPKRINNMPWAKQLFFSLFY
jgi:hypothetical protein